MIEITTGGAVGMTLEERMAPLVLEPEMASLDCGTTNFGDEYILNTMPMLRQCAAEMKRLGVRPTLECFDLSHVDTAAVLVKEGLVEPPLHYSVVLNVPRRRPLHSGNAQLLRQSSAGRCLLDGDWHRRPGFAGVDLRGACPRRLHPRGL